MHALLFPQPPHPSARDTQFPCAPRAAAASRAPCATSSATRRAAHRRTPCARARRAPPTRSRCRRAAPTRRHALRRRASARRATCRSTRRATPAPSGRGRSVASRRSVGCAPTARQRGTWPRPGPRSATTRPVSSADSQPAPSLAALCIVRAHVFELAVEDHRSIRRTAHSHTAAIPSLPLSYAAACVTCRLCRPQRRQGRVPVDQPYRWHLHAGVPRRALCNVLVAGLGDRDGAARR